MLYVGNDVVEYVERTPASKSSDARFLKRVLNSSEQSNLSQSSNPELVLWMFWAAKEAAFKIFSKIKGVDFFAPLDYTVVDPALTKLESANVLETSDVSENTVHLKVSAKYGAVPVEVRWNSQCLHAVGQVRSNVAKTDADVFECCWGQNDFGQATEETRQEFEAYQNAFTIEEKQSIKNPESAWVRYYAKKDIAQKIKTDYRDLQIIRPSKEGRMQPPYLLRQNKRASVDLSLSHHGSHAAWVFSYLSL